MHWPRGHVRVGATVRNRDPGPDNQGRTRPPSWGPRAILFLFSVRFHSAEERVAERFQSQGRGSSSQSSRPWALARLARLFRVVPSIERQNIFHGAVRQVDGRLFFDDFFRLGAGLFRPGDLATPCGHPRPGGEGPGRASSRVRVPSSTAPAAARTGRSRRRRRSRGSGRSIRSPDRRRRAIRFRPCGRPGRVLASGPT